jgi:hypothetical protein
MHFLPYCIKHYLGYPTVLTKHLESLYITTSSGIQLIFLSIKQQKNGQLLDYHRFTVVRPKRSSPSFTPSAALLLCPPTTHPSIAATGTTIPLTRNLCHQCLSHSCDDSLDNACRHQSLLGLPTRPFPKCTKPCPICTTTTFTHPPRPKESSYKPTCRGELVHLDFSFWNVVSVRGFASLLSIIDAKERNLWNFQTASKRPPLHILSYFLALLQKEILLSLLSGLMRTGL